MRKVLSLVLVLALVLGSFAFTFAATPSDVVGEDSEDAVNVLMDLGVVSGYPDGSYKPAGIVTRGEMAKIIICALGLEDYAAGSSSFSDMAGHWSDKFVAYAVSLGIINGYPDNTFKADNTVSYDEAAKMLVASLGYTEDSLVGSWPVNWVTKAKVLGILDDIKAGSAGANRGDIAIMTYQTLNQAIGMTTKDGEFVPSTPADTMLERLGASLYDPDENPAAGSATKPGDAFVLTDTHADEAVANVRDLVGAYVTAYANSDYEIIAIKEVKSTFLTGEFNAALSKFTADDVEYTVGKTMNTTVALGGPSYQGQLGTALGQYFLNGKAANGIAAAGLTEYKLAVDLSGKTIKDVYTLSVWNVTASEQVSKSDISRIERDHKLLGKTFAEDDNEDIDLSSFALIGVDSLSDIKEDDIVFVYDNGTITKVEVSDKVVTAEVTRIRSAKYTLDGVEYKISAVAGAPVPAAPGVGEEIEALIGPDNKIYDYTSVSGTANKYAVVLQTGNGSIGTGLNDTQLKIELFLADGTSGEYKVAKSKYNEAADTLYTGGTVLVAYPGGGVGAVNWALGAGDVVKYNIDSNGELTALTKTGFTAGPLDAPFTDKGTFNGLNVESNALVLSYTDAGGAGLPYSDDADDYDVIERDSLLDSDLEDVFYVTNSSNRIELMYVNSTSTSATSTYGVLTDTEENGSAAGYGVDLLIDGEAVFYNSADYSANSLTALYKITTNPAGEATLAAHGLAGARIKTITAPTARTLSGDVVSGVGFVYTLESDVVVYVWDAVDAVFEVGDDTDIEDASDVVLYDTDSTADGIYNIVLVTDVTAPTVVGATTKMLTATTFQIKFSEAVVAVVGDFADYNYDADGAGVGAPAAIAIVSIAGSGTDTITVTTAANAGFATGVGTATVDIAATVTDLLGNPITAVNDQAILTD